MRRLLTIPMFLAIATAAQIPQEAAKIDATLAGVTNGRVSVHLVFRNNAAKTITALAWQVDGEYADGTKASHAGTVDVISDLLPGNQGGFRPGVSREFSDALPLANGAKPVSVTAHLTMLVYEDDSAIGERDRIARFASARRSMAASEADELQSIETALKADAPKAAIRSAIAERERKGQRGGMIEQVAKLLDSGVAPGAAEAAADELRSHQQLLAAHSRLEAK
jgi:hypothetical protein